MSEGAYRRGIDKDWCEECRRPRIVTDYDTDYVLSGAIGITTEEEWRWTSFECGHENSYPTGKRYSTLNY